MSLNSSLYTSKNYALKLIALSVLKSTCANSCTPRIIVRAKRSNLKILEAGIKQYSKSLKNIQLYR